MNKSESIANIAVALCGLQTEIQDAPKDTQAYNYKYADLGTILHLVRPVMQSHNLSVSQFAVGDGENVGITTILMHTSGEWMENTIMMGVTPSAKMSLAQQAGSVLTYARRYSLAAVLGITQVDDDAVVEQPKPAAKKHSTKLATKKQKDFINAQDDAHIPARRLSWLQAEDNFDKMTEAQAKVIIGEIEELMK